jgi:hypothetical protein
MSWRIVCDLPMTSYQGNQVLDATAFHNNAHVLGSVTTQSGYVTYQGDDAQLEVPVQNDSLSRFAALRVQALVRPAAITRRYNIVEGWMSFAFFIESDGRLAGTIYDGQNWIGPDSGSVTVTPNQWARVSFEYDGVSIASLTLDGSVVGSRIDMPAGMWQPQGLITLGHWPQSDGRYTLQGDLGHVRIERRDYEEFWHDGMLTALCRRRLTPRQADAMREIDYLVRSMDPAERDGLRECAKAQADRLRAFLHDLRVWNRGGTVRLRRLGDALRAAWCCMLDAPAARAALLEYFRALAGTPGSADEERFRATVEEFLAIASMCAKNGYPYDRIRELCLVMFPEFSSFEVDFREIVESV